MSDFKRFKKQIKLLLETTDKENCLIIEPGTKGYVILSDTTGAFKVGVKMEDLKDAVDEAKILHSMYIEDKPEKEIVDATEGEIDLNNVGYGDDE